MRWVLCLGEHQARVRLQDSGPPGRRGTLGPLQASCCIAEGPESCSPEQRDPAAAIISLLRQAVAALVLLLTGLDRRFESWPSKAVQAAVSSSSQVLLEPAPTSAAPAAPSGSAGRPGLKIVSTGACTPLPGRIAGGGRFAFVTLLTRDSYLPGVQCLARSLRAAAARFPLLVLCTPDTLSTTAVETLRHEGCAPVPVHRYVPAGRQDYGLYKQPAYAECWTKLRMWQMEGYDRLVYLDADMVVTRNIDVLFELPPGFWAAGDCAYGRPTQEEREACALFCGGRPAYFNAGLYVMSPCAADFARFGQLLASGEITVGGYAEQDFLNAYFKGAWHALPHTFNAQKVIKLHHPQLWRPQELCVIHYVDEKPWHRDCPAHAPYKELVDLWWDVFEGRHAVQPPATLVECGLEGQ